MTTAYRSLSPEALRREYAEVSARFDALRELGLALNMARGKPGKAQLDLVTPGIMPALASSRKEIRESLKRRMNARRRPETRQRLTIRVGLALRGNMVKPI